MQLPDEAIEYDYRRVLMPASDAWTPLAELQAKHFLHAEKLEPLRTKLNAVRGQVAAERELQNPPAKLQPLQVGYIDLPQKLLDQYRKKGDASWVR
jgi:glucose-6-phosphate isomerase